jgi:hypothetical protein
VLPTATVSGASVPGQPSTAGTPGPQGPSGATGLTGATGPTRPAGPAGPVSTEAPSGSTRCGVFSLIYTMSKDNEDFS